MTVVAPIVEVTAEGNGATTIFSFSPVKIFASSHLLVKHVDAGGDETTLVEGTHYSVNIPASMYPATGSVSYPLAGVPLPSGESLLMRRVTPILQGTDLENQGGYDPETQEETFDYGRLIDQELARRIDVLESTVEGQDTIFVSGGTTADAISYDDDGNTMLTGVDDVQEAIDAADLLFASQASGLALKADKSITLSVAVGLLAAATSPATPRLSAWRQAPRPGIT